METPNAASFHRPLNFTLDIPTEMTYGGGSMIDGPLEPRIGRAQAMSVPAVKRSRDLICGTIGALPLRNYNAKREQIKSNLIDQPEIDRARSVTMTQVVEDMLFEGRAWLRITAYNWQGYPDKVVRLEPRSINVRQNQKVYYNTNTGASQGAAWEWVPDAELIRIDSPNDALLTAGARAIRRMLSLDKTTDRYARNPLPQGYFAPKNDNDPGNYDEIQEILDQWSEANKTRNWGYVGAALEAHVLQWSPEQLGLATARQEALLDIARIAGIDPEDLGINTTSRTYQNAEMRRLDLIDFTLAAYVGAIEGRLSMGDVTPAGQFVRFDYAHFLRSDTLTRMQTYQLGREVGVYNDKRIAELENIPSATVPKPSAPASAPDATQGPGPQPVPGQQRPTPAQVKASLPWATVAEPVPGSIRFAADEPMTLDFALDPATAEFKVDSAKRTISGTVVPWGMVARSGGRKWKFAKDSLHWGEDSSRVKLNKDHVRDQSFGAARALAGSDNGLAAAFAVGRGSFGDDMLSLAQDGVYDGFSIEVDFEPGDGWEVDPTDESVCLVYSATLRAVALTAMPAFDGARVAAVAAKREEIPMPKTAAELAAEAAAAEATEAKFNPTEFAAALGLEFAKIPAMVAEAVAALPVPQGRTEVPAGRGVAEVRETAVYSMNGGSGPSMVKDAWKARTEGDVEARDRLTKFSLQLADAQSKAGEVVAANFAAGNTTNAAAIIPPGYRPDLYVTQLLQGRPLWGSVSRGTLTDATPFTIPKFASASGMAGTGTEGTNPTVGSLGVSTITVTPNSVTGLFTITREIADSSNPAIDAIATQAMSEAYSQNTEAKLYALLNGAGGVGGTITAGQVPSGAWVYTTTGGSAGAGTLGGDKLLAGERLLLSQYPFHRFAAPTFAHLSQEATSAYATAVDGNGRPLLPSIGAQNSAGVGNAMTQGWYVDGLANVPTWSMTGNAAGDADVIVGNRQDVWAWESPTLTFRFEERGGPANIDLALFGYVACQVLRPGGLHAIRHTVGA